MQLSLTVLKYSREHKLSWSLLSVMYNVTSRMLSKFLLDLLWWALLPAAFLCWYHTATYWSALFAVLQDAKDNL